MGRADRLEEEKGYEGCSESDRESDVDRPTHRYTVDVVYLLRFQLPFLFFHIVRLENM